MTTERVRARYRDDSGVAAVEFAIVLPVLTLLLIGMLEFAFVMRDNLAVGNAVRIGARAAAAGAGDGQSTNVAVPLLAQNAAAAVQKAGIGLPEDSIEFVFVYKANANGYPGTLTSMPRTATACASASNCVVFTWDKPTNKLVYNSGTWTSSNVNACTNQSNADSVGIYMQVKHPFMTTRLPFMSQGMTVADKAVMKFEPLPYAECNGSGDLSNGGHI